jgi:hypothetical protein
MAVFDESSVLLLHAIFATQQQEKHSYESVVAIFPTSCHVCYFILAVAKNWAGR